MSRGLGKAEQAVLAKIQDNTSDGMPIAQVLIVNALSGQFAKPALRRAIGSLIQKGMVHSAESNWGSRWLDVRPVECARGLDLSAKDYTPAPLLSKTELPSLDAFKNCILDLLKETRKDVDFDTIKDKDAWQIYDLCHNLKDRGRVQASPKEMAALDLDDILPVLRHLRDGGEPMCIIKPMDSPKLHWGVQKRLGLFHSGIDIINQKAWKSLDSRSGHQYRKALKELEQDGKITITVRPAAYQYKGRAGRGVKQVALAM